MWLSIKRLAPGLTLIALAAILLLWSDSTRHRRSGPTAASDGGAPGRPMAKVALVQLADSPLLQQGADGVLLGLQESGLVRDRDFTIHVYNAQGDQAQLPLIMAAINNDGADLVVTVTTPAMIAAAKFIRDIPIVFTIASNPYVLGIFKEGQRQANLSGVYDDPTVGQLIDLAQKYEPGVKVVGTIWDPSQPNSEISVKKLREVCAKKKLTLTERTAAAVSELPDVTASICESGVQIIVLSADNLTAVGFPVIHQVAERFRIPIYTTEPAQVEQGAKAGVGDDFLEWGKQSGRMAAKLLRGASPLDIPFEKTAVQRTVVSGGRGMNRGQGSGARGRGEEGKKASDRGK